MATRDDLPLVSVIIPTYNRSKLLQQAVESVLNQTYPAIEVIVVDDGSPDDTEAVMKQYSGRIIYLKQANQGVSAARNFGFRTASGQYINFMDDDDLFMPAKIERQMQVFEKQPEMGLVHCGFVYVDEQGSPLDKVGRLPEREVLKNLIYRCFFWSGAPLIRRHCLERVGLFDEETWSACEEWDLWLRIALDFPVACAQETLGAYRMVPDSRMIANLTRLENGVFATMDRVFSAPQLPAEIATLKDHVYSNHHFHISNRYYASGHWTEAQRSLTQTLALNPQLLEKPEDMLQRFYFGALNVRTADPFQFVNDVFDHLPPGTESLQPYREQLLGKVYAGVALRNYGLGHLDEAQQQLTEALTLQPQWLDQPEEFLKLVRDTALTSFLDAPADFLAQLFNHLPPCAESLRIYHAPVLAQVYTGLALQNYGSGHIDVARGQLAQAFALNPELLDQTDDLSKMLCDTAMNLTVTPPFLYVETVFQNLPAGAQKLVRLRPQILSWVHIAYAFEDYAAGRRRSTVRRVLSGLYHRPSWLRNKGVVSIFIKSLPGLFAPKSL